MFTDKYKIGKILDSRLIITYLLLFLYFLILGYFYVYSLALDEFFKITDLEYLIMIFINLLMVFINFFLNIIIMRRKINNRINIINEGKKLILGFNHSFIQDYINNLLLILVGGPPLIVGTYIDYYIFEPIGNGTNEIVIITIFSIGLVFSFFIIYLFNHFFYYYKKIKFQSIIKIKEIRRKVNVYFGINKKIDFNIHLMIKDGQIIDKTKFWIKIKFYILPLIVFLSFKILIIIFYIINQISFFIFIVFFVINIIVFITFLLFGIHFKKNYLRSEPNYNWIFDLL
jgi:hypothetical protein